MRRNTLRLCIPTYVGLYLGSVTVLVFGVKKEQKGLFDRFPTPSGVTPGKYTIIHSDSCRM